MTIFIQIQRNLLKLSLMMSTILRTQKYINFLSGYYLKFYQISPSSVDYVLRSHSTASHYKINYESVVVNKIINERSTNDVKSLIERLREKYSLYQCFFYQDLNMVLKSIHNSSYSSPDNSNSLLEKDISTLIQSCGKSMNNEMPTVRAKLLNHLMQIIKSRGLKLNLSQYNVLLAVYLENEQDFSPAEILVEMSKNNIQPNEITYEYILTHYCQKGNINEANRILHYMKENQIPITEYIFNALIIGNAEANDINGALNILSIMKVMGCRASSKTYAALLRAYAKRGEIESIMETLKNCEFKNIIILDKYKLDTIYHLAINGQDKHIDKIVSTFSWDASFSHEIRNEISKLMSKKQVDVAFKLIMAAIEAKIPKVYLIAMSEAFGRNTILLDLPVEEVIGKFDILENEGLHLFQDTLFHSIQRQESKFYIPILRAWKKRNFELEVEHFWPILAIEGKKSTQGVKDILHLMQDEFSLEIKTDTILHFVLPYIKYYNLQEKFIPMLVSEYNLPFDAFINALLLRELTNKNIELAAKYINSIGNRNIKFAKEELNPLLENVLKVTGNQMAYNVIKSRLESQQDFRKMNMSETRPPFNKISLKFYPYLRQYDRERQLEKCSKEGDLSGAQECLAEIKNLNKKNSLNARRFLYYFDALVKNDRIQDALQEFQAFENFLFYRFDDKTYKKWIESLNLLAEKGLVEGVHKIYNILSKRGPFAARRFSSYIIKAHLAKKDIEGALEYAKFIQKKYGFIPNKVTLMKELIEAEKVEELQWFTDFNVEHNGEYSTFLPLAVAFIKAKRPFHCRRILASTTSTMKENLIKNVVNKLMIEDGIPAVKDFIQATKNLVSVNGGILYEALLEKCYMTNDWKEALALWNELQKDGLITSEQFLLILAELLRKNNQELPFPFEFSWIIDEKNFFYSKLIGIYFNNKVAPSEQFFKHIVNNIVQTGDMSTIDLIDKRWQNLYGNYLKGEPIKFQVAMKANNMDVYLTSIKKALDTNDSVEIERFVNSCKYKFVTYFLSHPEYIELFESIADHISSKHELFQPSLLMFSYYSLKDDPKIKQLWHRFPDPVIDSYKTYQYIVNSYVAADRFGQLSQLIERFSEFNNIFKKPFYDSILDVYDEQGSYQEGLRTLIKYEVKKRKNQQTIEKGEDIEMGSIKTQVAL